MNIDLDSLRQQQESCRAYADQMLANYYNVVQKRKEIAEDGKKRVETAQKGLEGAKQQLDAAETLHADTLKSAQEYDIQGRAHFDLGVSLCNEAKEKDALAKQKEAEARVLRQQEKESEADAAEHEAAELANEAAKLEQQGQALQQQGQEEFQTSQKLNETAAEAEKARDQAKKDYDDCAKNLQSEVQAVEEINKDWETHENDARYQNDQAQQAAAQATENLNQAEAAMSRYQSW